MLILASASPRRRELLAQAGFTFEVRPAHISEEPRANEDPIAYVVRLAREKAEAVYAGSSRSAAADPLRQAQGRLSTALRSAQDDKLVVLGADTTVVVDGVILGKPVDARDAARTEVAAEVTAVRFLTLSDEEIAEYVATGEPMDKAGAYAIQGRAAKWIPRIEGDYFNVVGLPIALVSTLLENM